MNKTIFISALLLLAALGCTSNQAVSQELQRQWMLVSFQNFTKEQLANQHANVDLSPTKTPENQYSAKMGCNSLFFTGNFKSNGTVEIKNVGGTMMYCKNMELEDSFTKAFPKITTYKVDGHQLILSDANGTVMKFIAADWD